LSGVAVFGNYVFHVCVFGLDKISL
jgi:hypothetical protein